MSVKCILTGRSGGSSSAVQSIRIKTPPNRIDYYSGDSFDKLGMIIMAAYEVDGEPFEANVTGNIEISPAILTDGITEVVISYTDSNGTTVTTTQAVTVAKKLKFLEVTNLPTIVEYEYQDTLATAGMVVTAIYSDESREQITPTSISPTALNTVGVQDITVSYKDESVDTPITTIFTVDVQRKTVAIPSWKGILTYNENTQSATSTSFWNNYNTDYMTMSGTISGINAGNYTVNFTPKNNYRWPDGSTTSKSVQWTIDKANYQLNFNLLTVNLDVDNYSVGVQVEVIRKGTGAITATVDKAGVTATVSGTTITVKGDGSTAGNFLVSVTVAADQNYNAPIGDNTFMVNARYFKLPFEDGANGDETFWNNVKEALPTSTAAEREACIGRIVWVDLNSAVAGTTTHRVQCVGYDCDGDKTLTFQAMDLLNDPVKYQGSTLSSYYPSSNVKLVCDDYETNFSGKNSIKTVNKACSETSETDVNYIPVKVFLPSQTEMGETAENFFDPLEFTKNNTSKISYQYYINNASRIKGPASSVSRAPDPAVTFLDYYWTSSQYYMAGSTLYIVESSTGTLSGRYMANSSLGLAPAFVIGNDPPALFENEAIGDATFWTDLKNSLSTSTIEQRALCVGKTVKVTLTSPVLDTTDHYVRCIGYDCDGYKTLTFQTDKVLNTNTLFGSNIWFDGTTNSTARTKCIEYYNAFPGKDSVKTVSKKYLLAPEFGLTEITYPADQIYEETCFLPSVAEMGALASSGSACYDEFALENIDNTPYQYYCGDISRIKYIFNTGGLRVNEPERPPAVSIDKQCQYWTKSQPGNIVPTPGGMNSLFLINLEGKPQLNSDGLSIATYGLAPAFVIGEAPRLEFEDGVTGNAAFWANLKNSLRNSTLEERQACLGKKVKVTLTSPVLGTTDHYVRCIGYDCDGDKTLTFQTMNCLVQKTEFGPTALWYDGSVNSTARAKCIEYYNLFPGKNAVKPVQKRYCSISDSSTSETADKIYTEYCFLLSNAEYSLPTSFNSASKLEFAVENTSNIPYQYFDSSRKRGKYLGTFKDPEEQTSGLDGEPWTRSRRGYYNGDRETELCRVRNNGGLTYGKCDAQFGLAPAFVIG